MSGSGAVGGSGKQFRFVRKVRRCKTCLYVPPYTPLLRRGVRGNVKTNLTPAAEPGGGDGER